MHTSQATAIAFGANHSASLLLTSDDNKSGHHSLYTVGRGASAAGLLVVCVLVTLVHDTHTPQPKTIPPFCASACGAARTGFYGQLGHGDYESSTELRELCIGYQTSVVGPEHRDACALYAAG